VGREVNCPGFPGDFNPREDGVYGNSEAVFGRSAGACCPAGSRAAGGAWLAVGKRAGLTSTERDRLKDLERENRELKRSNEILRKASAYFAQAELDRRGK
jgi:hypothetical protein